MHDMRYLGERQFNFMGTGAGNAFIFDFLSPNFHLMCHTASFVIEKKSFSLKNITSNMNYR
jgi:hypothetical protein